jgi:hypothetical protein
MTKANVVSIWGGEPYDPVPLSRLSYQVLKERLAINAAHRERLNDEWIALITELIDRAGRPTPPSGGGTPVPRPKGTRPRSGRSAA